MSQYFSMPPKKPVEHSLIINYSGLGSEDTDKIVSLLNDIL